ncbi:MAG TPA: GNAT family protein [Solirubrobacteraceae bacterium]|jgi:RimJ/RimL family protein N-acetyltransferase|nr:GNAT family protein [Solirubrobacteraceae bacterium]
MPSFPELLETLTDGVIEVRLAKEWDIPDILIAHQDDPGLYRRLGLDRPPSGAELGRRSEAEPAHRAAGTEARLTILESGEETCRGQIDVYRVDWDERLAEIGIWLASQVRGRGWAPRALRLTAEWLFGVCGLQRLTLLTEADNEPMIRAARSAGFTGPEPRSGRVSLTLVRPLPAPPTA